jgi:transcriptional regulator
MYIPKQFDEPRPEVMHKLMRARPLATLVTLNAADIESNHQRAVARPWAVTDAPPDFTAKLIESIIGIEIVITALQGKWKVSQNRPPQDRVSVVAGLCAHGDLEMADLVQAGGEPP